MGWDQGRCSKPERVRFFHNKPLLKQKEVEWEWELETVSRLPDPGVRLTAGYAQLEVIISVSEKSSIFRHATTHTSLWMNRTCKAGPHL